MGYTGDFISKNDCLKHFLGILQNTLNSNKIKSKISVYNYQDILLTEFKDNDIKEYTYFCLVYYFDDKSKMWRYKDMDHTVGPYIPDPVPTELLRTFIKNPACPDSEFSKDFIEKVKKRLHICKTPSVYI